MASRNFLTVFLVAFWFLSSFPAFNTQQQFSSMHYFGTIDPATSNGLLAYDYLASAFHLPSPSQQLEKKSTFEYGVGTALNATFFAQNGIQLQTPNNSAIEAQVDSFSSFLDSMCNSQQDCKKKLERTLFVLDQIGSNDYQYAFLHGKSLVEVMEFMPRIVQSIKKSIEELINAGASNLLVTGMMPMGYLPGYLTLFQTQDWMQYDDTYKCYSAMNAFAKLHNIHLRNALSSLRAEHPLVHIVYADTYKAFEAVLRDHRFLGFKKSSLMKACCGSGSGEYNFDPEKMCGKQGLAVCTDPFSYLHWDGFHLTQEGMEAIVETFKSGRGYLSAKTCHGALCRSRERIKFSWIFL